MFRYTITDPTDRLVQEGSGFVTRAHALWAVRRALADARMLTPTGVEDALRELTEGSYAVVAGWRVEVTEV